MGGIDEVCTCSNWAQLASLHAYLLCMQTGCGIEMKLFVPILAYIKLLNCTNTQVATMYRMQQPTPIQRRPPYVNSDFQILLQPLLTLPENDPSLYPHTSLYNEEIMLMFAFYI